MPCFKKYRLIFLLTILGILSAAQPAFSQNTEFEKLKQQAETYLERQSFSRAHEIYKQASEMNLSIEDARWVAFRLEDTRWRSASASNNPDRSLLESAQTALKHMVRDVKREEEKDRIWAEIQESLGDFQWTQNIYRNRGAGWNHYQKALDWWAGARDIETARVRYLNIIRTIAMPPWRDQHYRFDSYGWPISHEILEGALNIARKDEDKFLLQFLIAMSLRNQGHWNKHQRVQTAFEEAIKAGKTSEWYDDALYHYGEWLERRGQIIRMENGQTQQKADYVRALQIFRRIIQEFKPGETRYYKQAFNKAEGIPQPNLNISVPHIYLPGSKIEADIHWRNVKNIELSLYKIDLTKNITFPDSTRGNEWKNNLLAPPSQRLKQWTHATGDKGDYQTGRFFERLDEKLEPGAYLWMAKAGSLTMRELVLVTESAIMMKTAGNRALVYFADSGTGAPIKDATVKLWENHRKGRNSHWSSHELKTGSDGIAVFELEQDSRNVELFATARKDQRQAFASGSHYFYSNRQDTWKLYVTTDRPAYRPKETAHWKLTARTYDGSVYATPSGDTLEYQITDPRGVKLKEGTLTLNEFGSGWDELELTEELALGQYTVRFWTEDKKRNIGQAPLFRLEEYKLPEFKVTVKTPELNGKPKTFLLGDTVEVDINAQYYFGGPAANANVEVLVYQKSYYSYWRPTPEYPWLYQDIYPPRRSWGHGQQIKRQVLKTDAQGIAHLKLETNPGGQDLEYHIEARVTDSSRRQVTATGKVRVTDQKFYAYLNADHHLYRPQDKVTVNLKTLDSNQNPVSAKGTVKITRDVWYEIWIAPDGKEIQGKELKRRRHDSRIFPPPTPPHLPGWKLKFRGYRHDELETRQVTTNSEGEAVISFTPQEDGYYRLAFRHDDEKTKPITTETTVWVATHATQDIGYRQGGLEIIADKDTFRAGERVPVMLSVPTSDRYVLFSIEGDDLYHYQLVHVTGNVKLVQLDITEKHVPNIFLNGIMVTDHKMHQASKQVVVPPVKQFLTVDVALDKEQYQPQDKGTLTITTKDVDGKPVSAEVGVGLVDASVYAVQKDLAPDPRKFFYGQKRSQRVRTTSTFQSKRYSRLEENDKGALVPRRQRRDNIEGEYRLGEKKFDDNGAGMRMSRGFKKSGISGGMAQAKASAPMAMMSADASAPMESTEEMMANNEPGMTAGGDDSPTVQVRSDFRSTVFWQPDVVTDNNGTATVAVTFPDSLTEWQAIARAVTKKNRVGQGKGKTVTRKPLIARLQAPRFFVVGDEVILSGVINNNTDREMTVQADLEADGLAIKGQQVQGIILKGANLGVRVPAHGETRVDWSASAKSPGTARIKLIARSKNHADAMEKMYPVEEHGIEKFLARSGKLRGEDVDITVNLPDRKAGTTIMQVQVTPSIAVTMLDALPYLIHYPYGCTEQTLSRFLPAVMVAKTIKDLGLDPVKGLDRVFGGIEENFTGKTHPKGKNSLKELSSMVNKGLDRLYDFQHSDGGWGWWKKGDSDLFMSAYVVWGLALAVQAGEDVNPNALQRGHQFLYTHLVEAENRPDLQAWMLHAIATYRAVTKQPLLKKYARKAYDRLWTNRSSLNAYSRALLALTAVITKDNERAEILIENLESGVIEDHTPDTSIVQRGHQKNHASTLGTAHWGEDGIFHRWSNGGVEATSFALAALMAVNPKHRLVEPVMNWLVKNRRGSHWSNTRDTAIALMALTGYLKTSGELSAEAGYKIIVNGTEVASARVTDTLSGRSDFEIPQALLKTGDNSIRIEKTSGDGPLYFSAYTTFYSKEEPIQPTGSELFVRRQYYKRVGRATLLKGYVYDRVPLNDGGQVQSGDRVEVVLTLEAKNHYEYLIFEDLKPAGLEAVQIKSGTPLYAREIKSAAQTRRLSQGEPAPQKNSAAKNLKAIRGGMRPSIMPPPLPGPVPTPGGQDFTGRQRWVYQELRDRKVALFVDKLPQGVWEIRYELKAEVPGKFHALPLMGHAMYIPEIRANGQEIRLRVNDSPSASGRK